MAEIHDALILHAKEDETLVKQLQTDLLSNVEITELNVVLYRDFAPEVQSHFESMEILFNRCRYMLVVVTEHFKKDEFKIYQNAMALMDSIRKKEIKGRIIPVWAEAGADSLILNLSVLKGIEYKPLSDFTEDEKERAFKQFKKLFEHGRKCILSQPKV